MTHHHKFLSILILITTVVISCGGKSAKPAAADSKRISLTGDTVSGTGLQVLETWEMPKELAEISSNVFVGPDQMACIQDNFGMIFIYNLKTKSIESRISFAGKGDYEGLVFVKGIYYVLRSDGTIYQVEPGADKAKVTTYKTPLTVENDCEPMLYDSTRNAILIGTKEKDLTSNEGKGVYAFDLATFTFNDKPVYMIQDKISTENTESGEDGNAEGGKKKKKKKKGDTVKPSEIAIHPTTGELYVLNGPKSQLLVAGTDGTIKTYYELDKNIFPQPEGMCFAANGDLYISSEAGKNGTAIIARTKIN